MTLTKEPSFLSTVLKRSRKRNKHNHLLCSVRKKKAKRIFRSYVPKHEFV